MGFELSKRTANKVKALLGRSEPLPVNPTTNSTRNWDCFLEVTGDEIHSGFYPCICVQYKSNTDTWEEYSGSCVAFDCNGLALEVGKRYRALHVGINYVSEGGSGSGSGSGGGSGVVNQVFVVQEATAGGTTATTLKDSVRLVAIAALPANTYSNGSSGVGATLSATANGAFPVVDGYSTFLNDEILVTAESTASRNGIYKITDAGSVSTPWVLTRRSDMDETGEFVGALVPVRLGTLGTNTVWFCTNYTPPTVGSTSISFRRISGDIYGPSTATTDTAIAVWDGTSGRLLKNTNYTVGANINSIFNAQDGNPSFSAGQGFLAVRLNDVLTGTLLTDTCSIGAGGTGGSGPGLSFSHVGGTTLSIKNYLSEIHASTIYNGGFVLNATGNHTSTQKYSIIRYNTGISTRSDGIDGSCTVKVGGVDKTLTFVGGIVTGLS